MALAIRPYEEQDATVARACIIELQDAERQIDPRLRRGEDMADEYLLRMHARCREYGGIILVADAPGEIAGLVMVLFHVPFDQLDEPPGEYAVVAELVVREACRGRGVGALLLRAAEDRAREAGASELRIGVLSGNRVARELYMREGFAPYLETLSKPLDDRGIAPQ
jgi:ribosomal protein S18 acetylase RimI-like enzyme